jgi:CubicO group peptidase (beta-lactamase class C family)
VHVLKRPLPDVLKERVMDAIGASDTWHWDGYETSWVTIDGQRMQSVTGGGHWGGGMFINAWDMARFGYLFLENGVWHDMVVVDKRWIDLARTPGPANPSYGFMNWFLNAETPGRGGQMRRMYGAAPSTAVAFRGNGENIIYVDWENDLVVVVRWIRGANGFIERVMQALE